MAINFNDLKKSRKSSFDKLSDQLQKMNKGGYSNDEDRFWKPEVDKMGNGFAVIRFLPAPPNEEFPFIQYWDHGFQGPGGWYIERSLTTIGKPDPVSEYNGELWNSGVESNKEIARKQKRRLSYISNIYVVKDPAHPENEGKVFLFKYGKKIFEKINDVMFPQFGEEPFDPFNLWEGANFNLKIRNYEGYRNYDKSDFSKCGPLLDNDDKLEEIWQSEISLQEIISEDKFKSYDELKTKLYRVLGLSGGVTKTTSNNIEIEDQEEEFKPSFKSKPSESSMNNDEEDDDLAFFKNLADD